MANDWPKVRAKCLKLFIDQFLLISYVVAAIIALAWPVPGKAVMSVEVRLLRAAPVLCAGSRVM